jgi:hypothetical protein
MDHETTAAEMYLMSAQNNNSIVRLADGEIGGGGGSEKPLIHFVKIPSGGV